MSLFDFKWQQVPEGQRLYVKVPFADFEVRGTFRLRRFPRMARNLRRGGWKMEQVQTCMGWPMWFLRFVTWRAK